MNHWATLPVGCHLLCPMGATGEVGPGKAWSKPEPPDRACPKHPTGILQPPPLSPPGKTLIILHLLNISHSSRPRSISPAPKPPVGPRAPPSRAFGALSDQVGGVLRSRCLPAPSLHTRTMILYHLCALWPCSMPSTECV